ncbi:uncharacterized protein N7515_007200 [Penicillium bovifimosum]|uniref:Uncharacterized protein n=1 Tax=Penicillium bovifimosum TaxID=126998 RepID=A0A9W9GWD1_9EURO|nr:uncharacterized protein N7515_007200 [Penicillium bovifimosum]KAJ5131161.1 hypothetical protein N7515_007200 [Penicillium bovifimosum]
MSIGTYQYFAHEVFHEFYLTLTSEGLRELEYVAHDEIFSQHVERLWIVPSLFKAEYTWTPDEPKGTIEMEESFQYQRKFQQFHRLKRRMRADRLSEGAVRSPACSTNNQFHQLYLASRSDIPIEDRYVIYKDAVVDHFQVLLSSPGETSTDKSRLQDTLENCLPLLSNLHTIGLRYYRPDDVMRGISSLQRQLGVNPVDPFDPWEGYGKPYAERCSILRGSLFQSHVFSTLLAAVGTTHTRIAALETCGGMMVDDGLSVTPSVEEALVPIFQQLQRLRVYISSAHTQDSDRQSLCEDEAEVAFLLQHSAIWEERKNCPEIKKNRLLPLLAKAAPGVQNLDLTMHPTTRVSSLCQEKHGLDLTDAHFDWISQHFKFSRLSVLSLKSIITTVSSFKAFLKTALPTLEHLTLDYITWTSDLEIPLFYRDEGVRVCREVLTYLRDHSRVQCLSIGTWSYHKFPIEVADHFHTPSPPPIPSPPPRPRPRRTIPYSYWKRYDQRQDAISFVEWIDQLVVRADRLSSIPLLY